MASPPGAPWPLYGGRCDVGRPVHPCYECLGGSMHPRPCIHYLATYLSVRCSGEALWANSFMVGC